jgi:hypothetical protein
MISNSWDSNFTNKQTQLQNKDIYFIKYNKMIFLKSNVGIGFHYSQQVFWLLKLWLHPSIVKNKNGFLNCVIAYINVEAISIRWILSKIITCSHFARISISLLVSVFLLYVVLSSQFCLFSFAPRSICLRQMLWSFKPLHCAHYVVWV